VRSYWKRLSDESLKTRAMIRSEVSRRFRENPMNRRGFLTTTTGMAIAVGAAVDARDSEGTSVLLDECMRRAGARQFASLDGYSRDRARRTGSRKVPRKTDAALAFVSWVKSVRELSNDNVQKLRSHELQRPVERIESEIR